MKTVLFDFDGTIADSIPTILALINKVLKVYGYQPISKEELHEMRHKNIISILRHSKINIFFLPFMFLHGKLLFKKKVAQIEPFKGIGDVFSSLKDKGYQIGIVTSNSKESVWVFFEKHGFPNPDYIYASNSPFGKDRLINKCLKQNSIDKSEVVYVGDELRDIKACKKVGIPIVSVTWGFNTKQSLGEKSPEEIVDKISDLETKIVKLLK